MKWEMYMLPLNVESFVGVLYSGAHIKHGLLNCCAASSCTFLIVHNITEMSCFLLFSLILLFWAGQRSVKKKKKLLLHLSSPLHHLPAVHICLPSFDCLHDSSYCFSCWTPITSLFLPAMLHCRETEHKFHQSSMFVRESFILWFAFLSLNACKLPVSHLLIPISRAPKGAACSCATMSWVLKMIDVSSQGLWWFYIMFIVGFFVWLAIFSN